MSKIKRNAIQCKHCKVILESRHRHDFRQHECKQAGLVGRSYDHDTKEWKPDYPYMGVDGGHDYCRLLGDPEHYIILTELEPEA